MYHQTQSHISSFQYNIAKGTLGYQKQSQLFLGILHDSIAYEVGKLGSWMKLIIEWLAGTIHLNLTLLERRQVTEAISCVTYLGVPEVWIIVILICCFQNILHCSQGTKKRLLHVAAARSRSWTLNILELPAML